MRTPPILDPQIAARFKHFRKHHLQMSQEALRDELNITQRALSFIETGKRAPSSKLMTQMSTKYKLNSEWLMKGVGEPINNKKADPNAIDNVMARVAAIETQVESMNTQISKLQKTIEGMVKLLQQA